MGKGEDVIGRDTIVTCKFKNGRKKDSPMIAKDYRVLAVYVKFYNKWYISSDKKKWSPIMDNLKVSIVLKLEWWKMEYLRLLKM